MYKLFKASAYGIMAGLIACILMLAIFAHKHGFKASVALLPQRQIEMNMQFDDLFGYDHYSASIVYDTTREKIVSATIFTVR